MKKLALLFIPLFLFACSNDKKDKPTPEPATKQIVDDCVFPNTNTPAPGWICDEPVSGVEVSAVGITDDSKAGYSYMRDMAVLDGRGRLAEQMKVRVSKMVKKYLGTTGTKDTETIDAAASTTLKSVTSENLIGSKIYKSRTGPNKKLYVLVGIDAENAKKIAEHSSRTSMKNDNALWQQFKSKQSFDEMAKEISQQEVQ